MSIRTKIHKLNILLRNPQILLGKKKYLFVVSHMRSRSSVLCHILGNNPEVCGYKELHQSYKGHMSFINMQIALLKDINTDLRKKYLLDKLLNNFTITDEVLKSVQPKLLFLLREPEETIKSVVNMGLKTGVEWYKDPTKVTEYYCKRLKGLEELAIRSGQGQLFIDSEELVANSEGALRRISDWLNLEEPLKTKYTTFKNTGVIGFGDPLQNIKSGELKRTQSHSEITIPEELLGRARESYEKCRKSILKNVV